MSQPANRRPGGRQVVEAIRPDTLYRLDEAASRLGWGDHAVRAARLRGLTIHRSGKRNFVLGSDLIALVTGGKS